MARKGKNHTPITSDMHKVFMNNITHSSDTFFKEMLQNTDYAIDVIKRNTPPELRDRVLWEKLKHRPTLNINEQETLICDMVFEAPIDSETTDTIYFIAVLEQQTKVEKWMALRILNYALAIFFRQIDDAPDKPLPLVLPITIYTGEQPWTAATDFRELFGEFGQLAESFLITNQRVIDVGRLDTQSMSDTLSGLLLITYHLMSNLTTHKAFRSFYRELMREYDRKDGKKAAILMLDFIMKHSDARNHEIIEQTIREYNHPEQEDIMNMMQYLENRGYQGGYEAGARATGVEIWNAGNRTGWQEGRQEGRKEAAQELAKRFLKKGLSREDVADGTGLSLEEIDKLAG